MPALENYSDISNILNSLSSSTDPSAFLEELRNQFIQLKIDDQRSYANELDLMRIFDCINNQIAIDQLDTAVDILSRLLSKLDAIQVLQYCNELHRCLQHDSSTVKRFAVVQVERCLFDAGAAKYMANQLELLESVIECLGCAETEVAAAVVRLLRRLCSTTTNNNNSSSSSSSDQLQRHQLLSTGGCGEDSGGAGGWRLLLTAEPLLRKLLIVRQLNDTVRYRVYEVAVEAVCFSADALRVTSDVGLLTSLIEEASGDDVLTQLNALDLLATLAVTKHGFSYLVSDGVLARLDAQLALAARVDSTAAAAAAAGGNPGTRSSPASEAAIDDCTLLGLLKFFAQVGSVWPGHVMAHCAGFVDRLMQLLLLTTTATAAASSSSSQPGHQMAALDALACLTQSSQGKLGLADQLGARMDVCNEYIGKLLHASTSEVKLRVLDCIYHMLSVEDDDQTSSSSPSSDFSSISTSSSSRQTTVSQLTHQWLCQICTSCENPHSPAASCPQLSIEPVWRLARLPFVDVRVAALRVLTAMAAHHWGQTSMARAPGFLEFLLYRSGESCQPARRAKHDLVAALVRRPVAAGAFGPDALARLRTFHQQGALYVRAHAEVALDQP